MHGRCRKGTRELGGFRFSFAVFEVLLTVLAKPRVLELLALPHTLHTSLNREINERVNFAAKGTTQRYGPSYFFVFLFGF